MLDGILRCKKVRGILMLAGGLCATPVMAGDAGGIDRQALVARHHPHLLAMDVDSPFTVGNGGFAFGADITGLQTFDSLYQREGVPVETLSRWCWVQDANPEKFGLASASRDYRQGDGRVVPYPTEASNPAGDWLRKNPRNHPLGRIRLVYDKPSGGELTPQDIQHPDQTLDLWNGVLTSRFLLDHQAVEITTICHPEQDILAIRIRSKALLQQRLKLEVSFARGHDIGVKNTPALDWGGPETHQTVVEKRVPQRVDLLRIVAGTRYHVALGWSGTVDWKEGSPHHYLISPNGSSEEFSCGIQFSPQAISEAVPEFAEVQTASISAWNRHWLQGAMVDFSGSKDPRSAVLEKRVILSQYLTAVQMAGDTPPQESGLTCSTWYGKHHSEMIAWQSAHFALWGRDALLEKNLRWYRDRLPQARELARSRGLKGARWAKMTGPDGRESPGGNPLIMWNQPHMVFLCELLYRNHSNPETLTQWRDLVLETADCLASMAWKDPADGRYHLGPPLWIAQEIFDPAASRDPGFELAYWRWALETAQAWRVRLGMPREPQWDEVIHGLAPLPQKDGLYVALASHPFTFDDVAYRHDHPTMLAPLGLLPGNDVDRAIMNRTLDAVLTRWDWQTKIWGWDYPMIAMTAARLDRPKDALDVLLRDAPNNRYLPNGHCPQRSDEALLGGKLPEGRKREIAAYLPANGSFLAAVGMMVAGWDGSPREFPGFPTDGTWKLRAEGFTPMP